jgi:hypothetical protein
MTPSGIEPATLRFVAQHLNHCAIAVPVIGGGEGNIPSDALKLNFVLNSFVAFRYLYLCGKTGNTTYKILNISVRTSCLCHRASFPYNDVNNQQYATTFSFINHFNSALHVSGDKFAHPQKHFLTLLVCIAFGTMHRQCCQPVHRTKSYTYKES